MNVKIKLVICDNNGRDVYNLLGVNALVRTTIIWWNKLVSSSGIIIYLHYFDSVAERSNGEMALRITSSV